MVGWIIDIQKRFFLDTGLSGLWGHVYYLQYKDILLTDFAIKYFMPNFLRCCCEVKRKKLEKTSKKSSKNAKQVNKVFWFKFIAKDLIFWWKSYDFVQIVSISNDFKIKKYHFFQMKWIHLGKKVKKVKILTHAGTWTCNSF